VHTVTALSSTHFGSQEEVELHSAEKPVHIGDFSSTPQLVSAPLPDMTP
jgi:hypothetical protein